ncbi:MAG: hypothetical protein NUV57_04715 [archaeon]|nr:hypothetical protein [archaeon]
MQEIKSPKNVLLVGSKRLLKTAISKFKAKRIKEWKGKNFPLYKFSQGNTTLGLSYYFYGASAAAANLEDLVGAGAENFIFLTLGRPVNEELKTGSIILPTRAVRDEGTSFHYLKPAKQVIGNTEIEKKLKEEMKNESLKSHLGLTWTTDSPYSKARKTKEIVESNAISMDNDSSALFAVARYRKVNLGGIVLISEQTIRGRVKEKIKDPLRELKIHLLTICTKTLALKSFWDKLGEEKITEKKPVKKTPRKALWDDKINELSMRVDDELAKANTATEDSPTGEEQKDEEILDALLMKKEIFVTQYHRSRSKYLRYKLTDTVYTKISATCITMLEMILREIINAETKQEKLHKIIPYKESIISESDEAAEEIYAQIAEGEEPGFYREEDAPPLRHVYKNRAAIFLVNIPRRFRYKPYYKKFFTTDNRMVEINHQEFLDKY